MVVQPSVSADGHALKNQAPVGRMTDPQSASTFLHSAILRKVASDPVLQGSALSKPMHGSLHNSGASNSAAAASAAAQPTMFPSLNAASSPFLGVNNDQLQPSMLSLLSMGAGSGHLARATSTESSASSTNSPSSRNMPNSLYKVFACLLIMP